MRTRLHSSPQVRPCAKKLRHLRTTLLPPFSPAVTCGSVAHRKGCRETAAAGDDRESGLARHLPGVRFRIGQRLSRDEAGQTVAATIPAAVIAMALFRIPAFRGGILEQNIARTAASVGEALVAGAIFTIPAFMMVDIGGQRLWTDLRSHYWEATLILLVGGLIGVFFIILLRRPLCVDAPLPGPKALPATRS